MKPIRSLIVIVAALVLASISLAQERKPMSPAGVASTQVAGKWSAPDKDGERTYSGGKWIEIAYSRPVLRGRTGIFGKGADYGKTVNGGAPLWRAGANVTTTLKTEVPLEIGGKRLEPGEYSLFVDLKEAAWTLVVSKQAAPGEVRPEREGEDLGLLQLRPEAGRRAGPDDDGQARPSRWTSSRSRSWT